MRLLMGADFLIPLLQAAYLFQLTLFLRPFYEFIFLLNGLSILSFTDDWSRILLRREGGR